jgi:hypothetical protein
LSDALAPDKRGRTNCPSENLTYQHTSTGNVAAPTPDNTEVLTAISRLQASFDDLRRTVGTAVQFPSAVGSAAPFPSTTITGEGDNVSEADVNMESTDDSCGVIPSYTNWREFQRMYTIAMPDKHLFKPAREWTPQEKKEAGATSAISMMKLLSTDYVDFKQLLHVNMSVPLSVPIDDDFCAKAYEQYYLSHYLHATNGFGIQSKYWGKCTVDSLCKAVRLDKKARQPQTPNVHARAYMPVSHVV